MMVDAGTLACDACALAFGKVAGVWRLLTPDRAAHFAAFLSSYQMIRRAEGRGSADRQYYLSLPDCPATHPLHEQWRIRGRSFAALATWCRSRLAPGAKILDVGASTGWASHRLARAGFSPCAVDINLDDLDGLGAARHYAPGWPVLQAEFDRLPIASAEADAVLYNATLHYSPDYPVTLREGLRVLKPGGYVIILDSPVYNDETSGRRMLEEQHDDFARRFGDRSDSLDRVGFLSRSMLASLAAEFGFHWEVRTPWYGIAWALRPLIARLRGTREPAKFSLICARNPAVPR